MIIGFGLAHYAFESYLSIRQHKKLQETKPPKSLEAAVTQEVYDKSQVSWISVCVGRSVGTMKTNLGAF